MASRSQASSLGVWITDQNPPMRAVRLGSRDIAVDHQPDGTIYLRARQGLALYPQRLTDRLDYWGHVAPERIFLAQRTAAGHWRALTYAQTLERVRAIAAALLARDLSPLRPVMILSGNDIEHALLGLAANYVGIPYAPISPAYSLISSDYGRLRHIVDLLTPGLIFAADGAAFSHAIDAVVPPEIELVTTNQPVPGRPTTAFSDLIDDGIAPEVMWAHTAVGPDSIVKFLFTSGSTGWPKAVVNTERMWCANQEMLRTALAYFADEPPVIVDWAPWHHTAGGNHDVGLVLYNGGTLYIDEGKPLPGAIETTARNLREVAPTWYFTVPRGFEALLPYFHSDPALCTKFFSRLKVLWFAGAGIAQHVFDEMKHLAVKSCGEEVLFLTGFGATETAPAALARTWSTALATNVGLPVVGMQFKLVPNEGKLEGRVRGPNVTPGYWRQPELSAGAFDDEGFYKLGDAFKFADPADPTEGLLFDGRIAEDFKLATGTWVNVGPLRAQIVDHFAPLVRDAVLSGPNRDEIAALIFPDIEACRRLAPHLPAHTPPAAVLDDVAVSTHFACLLHSFAQKSTGSSNCVTRAMLMAEPPSLDLGEITDKGSINQRRVLSTRGAVVDDVHADQPSPRVIRVSSQRQNA